jgi:hypothetical protein
MRHSAELDTALAFGDTYPASVAEATSMSGLPLVGN